MEEIVESTLSLLSVKHDPNHPASSDFLSPIYFLALMDIKAIWFKKWTVSKKKVKEKPTKLVDFRRILKTLLITVFITDLIGC